MHETRSDIAALVSDMDEVQLRSGSVRLRRSRVFPSSSEALKRTASALSCLALALVLSRLPEYPGLGDPARRELFVLILAIGLWVSEVVPAFAAGLLVIALQIALLGRPGGGFAETPQDWEQFVQPWASPVIWLFFGGFVMGAAATKTGLDRRVATGLLSWTGRSLATVLLGAMGITFAFSMFLSNTAAAVLMIAALRPLWDTDPGDLVGSERTKALLLGITVAANTGGMGTVIGSPPNAIAASALAGTADVDFGRWMLLAAPPAVVIALGGWGLLLWHYRRGMFGLEVDPSELMSPRELPSGAPAPQVVVPSWQRWLTLLTFAGTVGMWVASPWHGIPTSVVSFGPIAVFTVAGVLSAEDMRGLPWEVLLLVAGGLSLGVGVTRTGLADWLVAQLPLGWPSWALVLAFSFLAVVLSNFMSNTAAANVLVPLCLAVQDGDMALMAIPVALAASLAMCLPVSTPPNAVAFASGRLTGKDFLLCGLSLGLAGPLVCLGWLRLVG